MEFHPVKAHREREIKQRVQLAAERVSAEVIDHLSENGDTELRIQIGAAPRRILPGDYLELIMEQTEQTLETRALRYAGRLVYDSQASLKASTERRDKGHYDWEHAIRPEGLTMVMRPAEISDSLAA